MMGKKAFAALVLILLSGVCPVYAQEIATTSATSTPTVATTSPSVSTIATSSSVSTSTPPVLPTNLDVESRVRAYFADVPVMISIAQCESRFRQFADSGNTLHGGTDGGMLGIFQIYGAIHENYAASLGMNINTVDGNMAYARKLYEQDGTDPWLSSFSCWKSATGAEVQTAPSISNTTTELTADLSLGTINPQVLSLQQILNKSGFQIAASGPGSPGQETQKFGALTRVAVRAFQCAQNIVCRGDEYTTGYGFVGARTRAALIKFSTGVTQASSQTQAASSPINTSEQYSAEQLQKIADLRAQIVALTQILQELLSKRNTTSQ